MKNIFHRQSDLNQDHKTKWRAVIICVLAAFVIIALSGYAVFHHYFSLLGRLDEPAQSADIPAVAEAIVETESPADEPEPEHEDEPVVPPASENEIKEIEADLTENLMEMEKDSELYSADVFNILLIGVDSRKDSMSGRSDAMILVSINRKTKTVTMTSFLRDIYLSIPNHGSNRLNASYVYGGTDLLKETIKANFGITVDRCVVVNFFLAMDIVDAIGGIELEPSEEEISVMNRYIRKQNKLLGNPAETDILSADSAGKIHANGNQALAYARVRYVGTDFARAGRLRTVIAKCLDKIRGMGIGEMKDLAEELLPRVKTDLVEGDCAMFLLMALDLDSYVFQSLTVPADGTWQYANIRGMSVITIDFAANSALWRETIEKNK